ncbi:hypothetical protein D3C84_145860 [compost metagenome]
MVVTERVTRPFSRLFHLPLILKVELSLRVFDDSPDETLKLIKRHVLGIRLVRAVGLDLDVLSIGQHVHGLHERIDAHGVQELARSQRQDGEGTGQHEEVVQHPVMHLTGLEVIRHTEVEVQVLSDLVE